MEWLVILGLGAWVWRQSRHIRTLKLKLAELEHAFHGFGDRGLVPSG